MDLNEKQLDCFNKLSRIFARGAANGKLTVVVKSAVRKGTSGKTQTKTNHAVRKGASGPNNNQNQPDLERAPADSKPLQFILCCKKLCVEPGSEICGGALRALLVLVCGWTACPLPNCAQFSCF